MISLLLRIWQSLMALSFKLGSRLTGIDKTLQSLLDDQAAMLRAFSGLADDMADVLSQLAQISDILIPEPAVRLVFTAHLDDGSTLNEVTKMDLRDDQKVSLSIQPVDSKGKPATVDGVPVWASSDETVVTVESAADGMSAMAFGVAPGVGRVVVTADADLGSGVTPLTGALDVNVTAGSAVSLTITAGTPANQ